MFATRSRLLSRPWMVASRRLFTSEIRAGRSNLLSGSRTVRTLPSASGRINTRSLSSAATATYDQSVESFPSIVIGANGSIVPQGSFAETQAQYLDPDPDAVANLRDAMIESNVGLVAHYYMDVELQGVLQAVKRSDERITDRVGIADSLKMGDLALEMCKGPNGVDAIACMGVDFMTESVQAILDRNGYGHIPVYRAASDKIGCSLAESAERDVYHAWLQTSASGPSLHVVYINTSLETKAVSSSLCPTITCTSSNVMATILQASAQIPELQNVLYGPDTYMGNNLVTFLDTIVNAPDWDDARIARDLHPQHSNDSLARLRDSINVFPSGNCVVHHMFGAEVVDTVRNDYDDVFVTAHLEVPGEMFGIAMEKSLEGRGTVGSTADILKFITEKVHEAAAKGPGAETERLRFILGTEAGMVTSVVKSVQNILEETGNDKVEAEIIFPVASDAVMEGDDDTMALVPGVAGGEGCSTAGGCATCPYMKMNDLDSLQDVVEMVGRHNSGASSSAESQVLQGHLLPSRIKGKKIGGVDAMDLGVEPILYMRQFIQNNELPGDLVEKVLRV